VRFYQRLLALDRDGAVDVVNAVLKQTPRVQVFDNVLVPALSRAEHDAARGELDETMQTFVWGVVGEVLDELEGTPDFSLEAVALSASGGADSNARDLVCEPVPILGLVADDTSDVLVLRMLEQLLTASRCTMEIIKDTDSSLQVVERVSDQTPRLVIVSHLPPEGSKLARYLVRKLRTQFADLPIVVGRWGGESDGSTSAVERLEEVGASRVVISLFDARAHILSVVGPQRKTGGVATALSG
jgi:hypothetical protein